MDDLLYDELDMTNNDSNAKLALIDSGNFSIQVPQTLFGNLYISMRK